MNHNDLYQYTKSLIDKKDPAHIQFSESLDDFLLQRDVYCRIHVKGLADLTTNTTGEYFTLTPKYYVEDWPEDFKGLDSDLSEGQFESLETWRVWFSLVARNNSRYNKDGNLGKPIKSFKRRLSFKNLFKKLGF